MRAIFIFLLFKLINFLESSFRFKAKFNKSYGIATYCLFLHKHNLFTISILHPSGTFAIIEGATSMHYHRPKAIVLIRAHFWWCAFYGIRPCKATCIHHGSIKQNTFTALTPGLFPLPIHPSLTPPIPKQLLSLLLCP